MRLTQEVTIGSVANYVLVDTLEGHTGKYNSGDEHF